MRIMATSILSTMAIGLLTTMFTMFTDVNTLKAEDKMKSRVLQRIEAKLERIEDKNDLIIKALLEN